MSTATTFKRQLNSRNYILILDFPKNNWYKYLPESESGWEIVPHLQRALNYTLLLAFIMKGITGSSTSSLVYHMTEAQLLHSGG